MCMRIVPRMWRIITMVSFSLLKESTIPETAIYSWFETDGFVPTAIRFRVRSLRHSSGYTMHFADRKCPAANFGGHHTESVTGQGKNEYTRRDNNNIKEFIERQSTIPTLSTAHTSSLCDTQWRAIHSNVPAIGTSKLATTSLHSSAVRHNFVWTIKHHAPSSF